MKTLTCRTDHATLLVAVADDVGVLRFPSDFTQANLYGLQCEVKPLLPVAPQLLAVASAALGRDVARFLELNHEFADEMTLSGESRTTLFVGRLDHPEIKAQATWLSLPDILRGFGKDRRRVPYMRALQVLTGALSLNTKAVSAEEVAGHLMGQSKDS